MIRSEGLMIDFLRFWKRVFQQTLINTGKEITIPEREVSIAGWTGTGYIVLDPVNGTGAYMIDGGLAGGALAYCLSTLGLLIMGVILFAMLGLSGGGSFVGALGCLMFMFSPLVLALPDPVIVTICALIALYTQVLSMMSPTIIGAAMVAGAGSACLVFAVVAVVVALIALAFWLYDEYSHNTVAGI